MYVSLLPHGTPQNPKQGNLIKLSVPWPALDCVFSFFPPPSSNPLGAIQTYLGCKKTSHHHPFVSALLSHLFCKCFAVFAFFTFGVQPSYLETAFLSAQKMGQTMDIWIIMLIWNSARTHPSKLHKILRITSFSLNSICRWHQARGE